jgi:hypothetical protein
MEHRRVFSCVSSKKRSHDVVGATPEVKMEGFSAFYGAGTSGKEMAIDKTARGVFPPKGEKMNDFFESAFHPMRFSPPGKRTL